MMRDDVMATNDDGINSAIYFLIWSTQSIAPIIYQGLRFMHLFTFIISHFAKTVSVDKTSNPIDFK
jgi:hypothetical protein